MLVNICQKQTGNVQDEMHMPNKLLAVILINKMINKKTDLNNYFLVIPLEYSWTLVSSKEA